MKQETTLVSGNKNVEIIRIVKNGTNRVFFFPIFEGKRINSTNYARKYDAENLGRAYLKHLATKQVA